MKAYFVHVRCSRHWYQTYMYIYNVDLDQNNDNLRESLIGRKFIVPKYRNEYAWSFHWKSAGLTDPSDSSFPTPIYARTLKLELQLEFQSQTTRIVYHTISLPARLQLKTNLRGVQLFQRCELPSCQMTDKWTWWSLHVKYGLYINQI